MGTRTSFETKRDFTINTSLGPVAFTRFFVSDAKQWWYWSLAETTALERVPKPFGAALPQSSGGPLGLHWWHTFFSLVHPVNDTIDGSEIWVREMDGAQSEFLSTATAGKWCSLATASKGASPSTRNRLKRTGSASYELFKEDGTALVYDQLFTDGTTGRKYYFLGKKRAANGRTLFEVVYGTPLDANDSPLMSSGSPCTDAPNGSGVPYIRTVNLTPNGANTSGQLKFVYESLLRQAGTSRDCVIKAIKWVPGGGGTHVTLATYSYNNGKSGDVTLFTDGVGVARESYGYDAGTSTVSKFEVKRGDLTVTYHGANGLGVVSASSGDGPASTVSEAAIANNCHALTCCNTQLQTTVRTMEWTSVNKGDGTTGTTSARHKFHYMLATNYFQHGEFIHQKEDIYDVGTAGAGGITKWYLTTLDGGSTTQADPNNICLGTAGRPGVIWAVQDKRSNFTVTPQRAADAGIGIASIELAQEILGASDRVGAGGLQAKSFTYSYGDGGVQRLVDTVQPSAITGGNTTITRNFYEAGTNRVTAVITKGETLLYDYPTSSVQTRYRAVFYKTSRVCDATGSDQILGRVTRIEGPCFVAASQWATPTGCDATVSPKFPVTEYVYFDEATTGNERGRVKYVRTYPDNTTSSCGTAIQTQYVGYTPFGQPLEVRQPNHAVNANDRTVFTYENDRLKTMTTYPGGTAATTTWNYENGILTSVQYPKGNGEVYCYRNGSGNVCNGAFTRSLQWKAKVALVDGGSGWTEKIAYEYHPDLALKREAHYATTDVNPRFERTYDNDADYRPTWEKEGTGSTLVGVRAFDKLDNLVGLGPAANAPTPFCATNQYACRHLSYDRANRLVTLDAFPDGVSTAGGIKTCFDYDGQGNVRRVAAGCANGATCSTNQSTGASTTCSAAPVDYDVDDFGNTVAVKFPWTSETSGLAVTRYEYDAVGNVVVKQTAQMRFDNKRLEYGYDSQGRLTSATRRGGTDITLFTLRYDSSQVAASCPTLSNTIGRLSRRNDSFGYTYYSYDEEGRVLKEVRLRDPAINTSCASAHSNVSPHTNYTYDLNGNLTAIRYPRGRTVSYTYASGTDRVTAIARDLWNGTSWGALGTVLDSVAWEPYGGLRGYRLSGWGGLLEYYKGANLESAPTYSSGSGCDTQNIDGPGHDGSSRIRGVYLSNSWSGATLGAPTGDMFKQVYRWQADQLVNQYTCTHSYWYSSNNPVVTDTFAYDSTQRLVSEATTASAGLGEGFAYDLRGNRTSSTPTGPGCTVSNLASTGASHQVDLLAALSWTSSTCNGAAGLYYYDYDRDGRRTLKRDFSWLYAVSHAYAQGALGEGLDSVYGSATISGTTSVAGAYSYFYDAFGRRRAKLNAWSTTDEMFHDLGHQLLNDVGTNAKTSASYYSSDDYLWLGGRVVDIIRAPLDLNLAHSSPEGSYQCDRAGEVSACGDHYQLTDYLGKPVASLNLSGYIDGLPRYQAFGAAHRREARHASPHNTAGSGTLMTVNENMPTHFDGFARVLLNKSSFKGRTESLAFNGVNQPFAGTGTTEVASAHMWTSSEYRNTTGWALSYYLLGTTYGFDVEAYEVKLKQAGFHWFGTPLRFPGQYYDAETELHENWNRIYDPQGGRYLQPEPLLHNSAASRYFGGMGHYLSSHTYGLNNPLAFVDQDGRFPNPSRFVVPPSPDFSESQFNEEFRKPLKFRRPPPEPIYPPNRDFLPPGYDPDRGNPPGWPLPIPFPKGFPQEAPIRQCSR